MSPFEKIGAWILIAAAILLPLYELADYTEAWPHDGSLILTAFAGLLTGMALIGGAFFRSALTALFSAFVGRYRLLCLPRPMAPGCRNTLEYAPPRRSLPLTFRDLRI